MPGWVPGASSKNCGGPQYSLTKGLADGFTARVLIPQWQPYAAVELEFSEGWEFQIERVWGAARLPELGISAYSQRKTFVLDATAPVVHGPEGYGCFGDCYGVHLIVAAIVKLEVAPAGASSSS